MNAIIQELSQIGEVTLVRFVDETMWVTFRDGQSTLSAVAKGQVEVRPCLTPEMMTSGLSFPFSIVRFADYN